MAAASIGHPDFSDSPHPLNLLVLDADEATRKLLERHLTASGHILHLADRAEEALSLMASGPLDMLLLGLPLSDADPLEVMRSFQERHRDGQILIVSDQAHVELAVKALQAGAFDVLLKPLEPIDRIQRRIAIAAEYRRLSRERFMLNRENQTLRGQVKTKYRFDGIIAPSQAMQGVLRQVEKVAEADSTVLILGESGTGKELIARAIHYNSPRRNHLLVAVNCSAIPATLLESELFGHVKGAFTGAINSRIGRFQMADGGTIFLDEIGDMPQNLQVRLLRVLQEHEISPVGAGRTVKVNVRVIAATNVDLDAAVRERRFREDLYYRLNVIPIVLPPLRERPEEIRALASHFLEVHNADKAKAVKGIAESALELLEAYDWPGNVRELEHTLERVVVMKGNGEIGPADLPERIRFSGDNRAKRFRIEIPEDGIFFTEIVRDFENDLILQALERTRWNKNQAAALLGLNRTTLVEKIKKKRLRPSPPSRP